MEPIRLATGAQSRRLFVRRAVAVALLGAAGSVARTSASPSDPAVWRTWLLDEGNEERPANPGAPSDDERIELLAHQAERTALTAATVAKWGDGPAVLPWTDLALDLIRLHQSSPVRAARALALLHTALHDVVVAVRDAKQAYPRTAPWRSEGNLMPIGRFDSLEDSSFPSEHAAVAAAASLVLTYTFPNEPAEGLLALADEAATSRLWAGASYRSDVEAGLAIGRAVGERAVQRGTTDGSEAIWDVTGRPDDAAWQPTPPGFVQQPLDPLAGTWRPWIVTGGDQFRPSPPPSPGSMAWEAELAAVQEAVGRRTAEQETAVHFWAGGPGTETPAGIWTGIGRDLVVRYELATPHAARVLALATVAMADALVCCWDAKYAYWVARPITADPNLDVLIPTPPFPSYTSGHATASFAAATVLGHLFPAQAAELAVRAVEAKDSRLWAGIHFTLDNDMGALGGGLIGRLVVDRARGDRAE